MYVKIIHFLTLTQSVFICSIYTFGDIGYGSF